MHNLSSSVFLQVALPNAVIIDVDSTNATRLEILLTGIMDGSDETLSEGETSGITVSQTQNSTHIRRNITGSRDIATYITLLKALSYHNAHPEPTPGLRTAALQVFTLGEDGVEVGSDYAFAVIAVTPTNDQAPNFTQAQYSGSVAENTPVGTFINITVTAVDFDVHGNTNITYRLLDTSNALFAVDPVSGDISVAQLLDFDTMDPEVQFIVVAEDNDGGISMSATAMVLVSILDVNDNHPVFSLLEYKGDVPENAINGTVVLNISASDADSGRNGDISFSISDITSAAMFPFRVTAESGLVYVAGNGALDFEQEQVYNFSVVASDHGAFPLTAVVPVVIRALDVNDNPPVFDAPEYRVSISELSAPGTLVVNVSAQDQDSGLNGMVRYSLRSEQLIFSINEVTGAIRLENNLDYENVTEHVIHVVATDLGNPPHEATVFVYVMVINENDNPPVFSPNTVSITVMEATPAPVFVYRAAVTDLDMDQITYTLSYVNDADSVGFTVNSTTGEVYANMSLDRELVDFYQLTIGATDRPGNNSFSASLLLLVSVSDTNDNAPGFSEVVYLVDVSEDLPPGSFVAQLQATDADLGTNAEVTYSISVGNENGAFAIDPVSGNITVNMPLDHEDLARYDLIVTAVDGGMPPRTGTAFVAVNVIDINDERPMVQFPQSEVNYEEDSGTVPILQGISITDSDGDNHQITRAIIRLVTTCNVSAADLASCGNITNCVELCGELLYLDPMAAVAGGLMAERGYKETESDTVTQVKHMV